MEHITIIFTVISLVYGVPLITTNESLQKAGVIGGSSVDRGEFPFLLSLQRIMFGVGVHICGATIYSHRWVISAAHCLNYVTVGEEYLKVVAGDHNLREDEGTEQSVGVIQAIIHGAFDPVTNANDIVLLRLKENLLYNDYVQPINIPFMGYQPQGSCVLPGWGSISEEGSSIDTPMKVELPIVSDILCSHYYEGSFISIQSSMLCAGYQDGGADACNGDDGGPLVCTAGSYTFLAGISSLGIGCGRPNRPGIYTEVSYYVNWIVAVTR